MSKLEDVARAIYVKRCERCGYRPFPQQSLSAAARTMLADEARAAIDALMEPSPEMIAAGVTTAEMNTGASLDDDVRNSWQAMLRSAKGDAT